MFLPLLKQQESLWAARKLKRQPPIDVRMAASVWLGSAADADFQCIITVLLYLCASN